MYVTKAEREYARSLAFLKEAQFHLCCARLIAEQAEVKQAESHVLRMLRYAANAQDWVLRQRKRDPGSIFAQAMSIPFTLDVAS